MKMVAASLLVGALITPSGPTEPVTVFVELTSTAAVDTASVTQARSARDRTSASASRVVSRSGGREVARTSNAVPGVSNTGDARNPDREAGTPAARVGSLDVSWSITLSIAVPQST